MNRRIQKGVVDRGRSFEIEVDGEKILAYETSGEKSRG